MNVKDKEKLLGMYMGIRMIYVSLKEKKKKKNKSGVLVNLNKIAKMAYN